MRPGGSGLLGPAAWTWTLLPPSVLVCTRTLLPDLAGPRWPLSWGAPGGLSGAAHTLPCGHSVGDSGNRSPCSRRDHQPCLITHSVCFTVCPSAGRPCACLLLRSPAEASGGCHRGGSSGPAGLHGLRKQVAEAEEGPVELGRARGEEDSPGQGTERWRAPERVPRGGAGGPQAGRARPC